MHPVLREVSDEHDLRELEGEWLRRHRILEPRLSRPPEEQRRRQHRQHDRHLHHEMAHGEVHEIGRPARPEDRLLGQARDDALDGDEEQRQNEQVQQEPVQSHRGRSSHRPELGARASEQGAGRGEGDAGEAEDLAATKHDTQRPETEADDEHHVNQETDQVHRI